MRKRRRYGRKIRRSRTNLYRKKKTKLQKAAGTVLLILILLAIAFLGYCLGKPILEFFEKNAAREDPVWTPPAQTPGTEELPEPEESETSAVSEEPPVSDEKTRAITAPSTALLNSASLSAFAAKAKNDGYNTVVLELKDENGYLHYDSPAARSRGEELVQAPLSAGEIASILKNAELYPVASVCALRDNAGCTAAPEMSYKIVDSGDMSWLDYSTDLPLRWADPASGAAREYLNEIVGELTDAGITVMLRELAFPDFQSYDRQFIASPYFEESRSALLLPLLPEKTPVEMLAEDIIGESYGRTAELLRVEDFSEGAENTIAVRIRRAGFSAENGYPADAAGLIEDILARVREKAPSLAILPVIEKEGFTEAELAAVKETLNETGYVLD